MLSLIWAPAVPKSLQGLCEVISARLNRSHGTIDVGRVCNFLDSVSSQEKFEAMDQGYILWTNYVTALGQIGVTAPCYSSVLFRK